MGEIFEKFNTGQEAAQELTELMFGAASVKWRQGRRVGQCIHAMVGKEPSEDDVLIAVAMSPNIAGVIVLAHNEMFRDD